MFHSIDFYRPDLMNVVETVTFATTDLQLGYISYMDGSLIPGSSSGFYTKNKIYLKAGAVVYHANSSNQISYNLKLYRYENNTTSESGYYGNPEGYTSVSYTAGPYTIQKSGYYHLYVSPTSGSATNQQYATAAAVLHIEKDPDEKKCNTYSDWYLVPSKRPVFATPAVKKHVVEIPGGDGSIDMTEALAGRPTYSNRTGSFEFYVLNDYSEYGPKVYDWVSIHEDLMAFLHGQRRYAVLEDDPGYFYDGRFTVDDWSSESDYARVTIGYDVAPFKYKVDPTDITLETGTIPISGEHAGQDAESTNAARSAGNPIQFHKGDRIRMESSGLYGNAHHLMQVMYYPGNSASSYVEEGGLVHTYNSGGNEYVFTKDGYYRFVFQKYNNSTISDDDLVAIKDQIRLYERGLL